MSYLSATELSLLLPQGVSIGTNTDPLTLGEVASVIFEVSAELDGTLAQAGYDVPIASTATGAYAQLQRWTRHGAAYEVMRILVPNMGSPGASSTLAEEYRQAYENALKMIRDGQISLVGVGFSSGETGRTLPRSFSTTNTGADAIERGATSQFPRTWEP